MNSLPLLWTGAGAGGSGAHGGTDALGVPEHDFSTNRNALGPCPQVVEALAQAHVAQYPDPAYTHLRQRLAQWHGVACERIVLAASASEFIHRITAHAWRCGARQVSLPAHSYGDYQQAAQAWGLAEQRRTALLEAGQVSRDEQMALAWSCAPSSPLGCADDLLLPGAQPAPGVGWWVIDCAYRPLRLQEAQAALQHLGSGQDDLPDTAWQLWTPNKALGMTGVRGAYAIAPGRSLDGNCAELGQQVQALQSLAASWVLGAHGVAMLQAWTEPAVQQWLAHSRQLLAQWKRQQLALCAKLGWQVHSPGQANYWVAHWPAHLHAHMPALLHSLRVQAGIKLRDATGFGLPGAVRMAVLSPSSQQALAQAWPRALARLAVHPISAADAALSPPIGPLSP